MSDSHSFAAVLDQASDAILITDSDLASPGPKILYANASFCRMTGYSVEELLGQSPRLLQGPETDRKVLDQLVATLASGLPYIGHTTNYRKDRTPFEIEWQISPIRSSDGRVIQYLSLHRDVTERKSFERSIEQHVRRLHDERNQQSARQQELETSNTRLQLLAATDGLTGVFNHRYFHEALGRIHEVSGPVSLLMVDVDQFKSFNDTFGHPCGDTVLQAVAQVLRTLSRKTDTVARYGGEEFAVLMPNTDADAALAVAERIRRAVEVINVPQRALSVSVGVSSMKACDEAGRALLTQADAALYAAKASGRNRVVHHRHQRLNSGVPRATHECKPQCAPSANGCLRCESVPAGKVTATSGLVLGPQDSDANAAIRQVLSSAGFQYTTTGPVLIVPDMRNRLQEIGTLLKNCLSPLTQANVAASYVNSGLATPEQVMSALLFARPLAELLHNLEHEWIREALSDGWLFSVFHPIIHATTGELFAQEALLRARNSHTQQVLGAGQIINACEKLNLLHQLDQRARQSAIRAAAEHVPGPARIFINFLPNTIYDPEICLRTTMEAAEQFNVPMSRLVFEVVETEKIPDMAHLRHILDYYRKRGVGTAIDDMGAGFTGVDYITSLQPEFVKLDREFVLAAEQTAEGRTQMDLMVRVAKEQGAKLIAEGIETEAQMEMCVDAGVDFLQGFFFAKPACPPQRVSFAKSEKRAA